MYVWKILSPQCTHFLDPVAVGLFAHDCHSVTLRERAGEGAAKELHIQRHLPEDVPYWKAVDRRKTRGAEVNQEVCRVVGSRHDVHAAATVRRIAHDEELTIRDAALQPLGNRPGVRQQVVRELQRHSLKALALHVRCYLVELVDQRQVFGRGFGSAHGVAEFGASAAGRRAAAKHQQVRHLSRLICALRSEPAGRPRVHDCGVRGCCDADERSVRWV